MTQPVSIDMKPTLDLHQQIIERWQANPSEFVSASAEATEALDRRGIRFGGERKVFIKLSALLLTSAEMLRIRGLVETLHDLVERTLDWLIEDEDRLISFFPDHRRIFPYLSRTPGLSSWQGYSRYDAILTPNGQLKIVELNTGCPAGLLGGSSTIAEETADALAKLGIDRAPDVSGFATLPRELFLNELLEMEAASNLSPGLIAILNDENKLTYELERMAGEFRDRGREAVVANAAELALQNGRTALGGKPVSLSFNKMRISTERSPNHNWKPGFEERYAAFLQGITERTFVAVNNICAMTVAEDKGLLAVLFDPRVQELFSDAERQFLRVTMLPVARLSTGGAFLGGKKIVLPDDAIAYRDSLVIKPANEGRGFGVAVGKFCSPVDWEAACQPNPDLPGIVQEYAEPVQVPIVSHRDGEGRVVPMYTTLGLGVIRGKFHGIMSRISSNPITNVAQHGMVQAVFRV